MTHGSEMARGFSMAALRVAAVLAMVLPAGADPAFHAWAPAPPMGWNSWDCFGPTVTEAEVKANADYMAAHLKPAGWEYVVVDIRWYVANDKAHGYEPNPILRLDDYGRFWPATNRFPSAAGSAGFRPLADYVHDRGLKFGVHIMRGIPRAAVERNLPMKNSAHRAADVANTASRCAWLADMYGVDMARPGAQDWYDAWIGLLAEWHVDYLKIDDLSAPYAKAEIEGIRRAIDKTGRPIVLSLSPGPTPLAEAVHAAGHANLWRTTGDFWDDWPALKRAFAVAADWAPHAGPGHWPDHDMLPLGRIGIRAEVGDPRPTRFTRDEQVTLLTLWSIARSPLMFGGHLPDNDPFTLALLTNRAALAVNQASAGNRPVLRDGDRVAWAADVPGSADRYLALFNLGDAAALDPAGVRFRSPVVTRDSPGQAVAVTADIAGARKLYLVVEDGGDDFVCDHANWIEPVLQGPAGVLKLTGLKWAGATTGWGTVQAGRSASGGALVVAGKTYADGIGAHSTSVIEYDLPPDYTRFTALGGLDEGGVRQALPGATVRFVVGTAVSSAETRVELSALGLQGPCRVRDLWRGRDLGEHAGSFGAVLPPHGAGLYRLAPTSSPSAAGRPSDSPAESSARADVPATAYLFTYFIGNGEDGLHLAWSRDGLKWEALNGGRSLLAPAVGESKLMRDPCVARGPDGTFHMVWTTSWGGKTIGHAATRDFIAWTPQQAIPVMAHEPTVKNCWAPEVLWDAGRSRFLVFWASTIPGRFPATQVAAEGGNNHRIYCTATADFAAFEPTRLFYEPGFNVIDATICESPRGRWRMVVKDETAAPPKKHLRVAAAADPEGPYGELAPPFTRDWVEGPTALAVGDATIVYYDCYRDHRYGALRTRDWSSWEDVTPQLVMPKGARHGTAIAVEGAIVARLLQR